MQKKKVFFFIDSLNGGGAERVASVIANAICDKFDLTFVLLRKEPIVYDLNDRIQILYLEDLPINSIIHRIIQKAFFPISYLRNRIYKPIAHGGVQEEEAEQNSGSFEAPNQDAWTYSNIK